MKETMPQVITEPGKISFQEVDIPETQADQEFVKIKRIGVCGRCCPCLHGKYNLCENLKVMDFQTTGTASDYFAVDASNVKLCRMK